MMDFLNNATITVGRRSSSLKNSYGEKIYSTPTTIYSNIRCRYDDFGGTTQFNEQGERIVSTRKILVDPSYTILEEDVITVNYDNIPRRVIKVMPTFGPFGSVYANEITLLDP